MTINVIELQPCGAKARKLCLKFRFGLLLKARGKEELYSKFHRVSRKAAVRSDEIRYFVAREHGARVHQRQVKANTEGRKPPCTLYGVLGTGRADQHACRGQDSVAMAALDGLVEGRGHPEVISGKDGCLHP